ncbi:MAG: beta-N-acetylhexosaminidase [Cellvibrionaceae bacterium]|nr:beta-N-acetylhexosaminidase [Cellvibrionaceae bacterium]
MLDLQGLSLAADERELLAHPAVGGVIFFARNYASSQQISQFCRSIRAIRPDILLAVDQEGGRVQRFTSGFTRLPAMQQFLPLYRKNPDAALGLLRNCAWLMAAELLAVGIDFSFAPVLDSDDKTCAVIADRAFSPKPEEVVALAGAWIAGMHEAGMAATGKHFPGHGGVTADSHLALPVDERELDVIAQADLIPFTALASELDGMMPAHIVFPQVDKQAVGFSTYWLQTLLRKQLGFQGVIFSDDLSMAGAASVGDYTARAQSALAAGCDMILVCNNRQAVVDILDYFSALPKIPSSSRLGAMRARQHMDWDALQAMPRCLSTKQFLTSLIST